MAAIMINNRAARRQTVDTAVDAYLDWRDDCVLLDAAYSAWANASRSEKALMFVIYQRALDREEYTANAYAELIRSVGHLAEPDLARQMAGIPPGPAG